MTHLPPIGVNNLGQTRHARKGVRSLEKTVGTQRQRQSKERHNSTCRQITSTRTAHAVEHPLPLGQHHSLRTSPVRCLASSIRHDGHREPSRSRLPIFCNPCSVSTCRMRDKSPFSLASPQALPNRCGWEPGVGQHWAGLGPALSSRDRLENGVGFADQPDCGGSWGADSRRRWTTAELRGPCARRQNLRLSVPVVSMSMRR